MNILVIEDEPKLAEFIKKGLEEENFNIDVAFDGSIGERMALKNNYDIIVLDVILPYKNGFEVCKAIRAKKQNTPIIMLSALDALDDKITGFNSGVDDYLVKPFEFKELLARIHSLLKRSKGIIISTDMLKVGDLQLDIDKRIAIRGNTSIDLTAKEFKLLEYLMRNKGRVISRNDISEKVWDINFDTGTNTVDVYINILRKKIDKDSPNKLIHTKIGMGYYISDNQ